MTRTTSTTWWWSRQTTGLQASPPRGKSISLSSPYLGTYPCVLSVSVESSYLKTHSAHSLTQREVVKWLDEPQFLQRASLLGSNRWAVSTDGAELRSSIPVRAVHWQCMASAPTYRRTAPGSIRAANSRPALQAHSTRGLPVGRLRDRRDRHRRHRTGAPDQERRLRQPPGVVARWHSTRLRSAQHHASRNRSDLYEDGSEG